MSTTGRSPEVVSQMRRRRAVRAFYAYRILSRSYFHLPVLLIWFMDEQRLSVLKAGILLALYGAALTYGAPVAARMQERLPSVGAVVPGEIAKTLGLLTLVAAGANVFAAAGAQVVGGLGYSLAQGPDSVLLRSLYSDEEAVEYSTHESRSMSWVFVSVLVAGVLGGVLYSREPRLPFLASAVFTSLATLAAGRLGGLAAAPRSADREQNQRPTRRQVAVGAIERRWMLYYATMRAFSLAAFVGLLPIVFFYELKVDVQLFGLVLGSFSLLAYVSGRYGVELLARIPDRFIPPASLAVLGAALAILAAAPDLRLALLGMALLGAVSGVVRPLTMGRLNSLLGRTGLDRGVIIGRMERLYGLLNGSIILLGALITNQYGVDAALWTLSVSTILLCAVQTGVLERRGRVGGG